MFPASGRGSKRALMYRPQCQGYMFPVFGRGSKQSPHPVRNATGNMLPVFGERIKTPFTRKNRKTILYSLLPARIKTKASVRIGIICAFPASAQPETSVSWRRSRLVVRNKFTTHVATNALRWAGIETTRRSISATLPLKSRQQGIETAL